MITLFEFPRRDVVYSNSTIKEVDGERVLTTNALIFEELGGGRSMFQYTIPSSGNPAGGLAVGVADGPRRRFVVKFNVNSDYTGSIDWIFATNSINNQQAVNTYLLYSATLKKYGAVGIVNVTIEHCTATSATTYPFANGARIRLYINGQLVETLSSVSGSPTILDRVTRIALPYTGLRIPTGVEISSVITYMDSYQDTTIPNWLLSNHKVVNLNPVEQLPVAGTSVTISPNQFKNGFQIEETCRLKYRTDYVPIEGAKCIMVCASGYVNYRRRSPKGGAVTTYPFTGDRVVQLRSTTTYNQPSIENLSLLDVGVSTLTQLAGYRNLNDVEDPEPFQIVGMVTNITL